MRKLMLIIMLGVLAVPGAFAQDAAEIVRQIDRTMNPNCQMQGVLEFYESGKLVETYRMTVRARDNNQKVIVRFRAPARQVGNDLIMLEQSVWAFDVKSGRTMKVASNQSFGDTGFSYGDIVRLNLTDNYSAAISAEDAGTWTLTLTATQREAPYARIEMVVRKNGVYPVEARCFSRSEKHLKTITYSEVKTVNGRTKPTVISVYSPFEPDNLSVMRFSDELFKEYPDYLFNKRVLETRQDENF